MKQQLISIKQLLILYPPEELVNTHKKWLPEIKEIGGIFFKLTDTHRHGLKYQANKQKPKPESK